METMITSNAAPWYDLSIVHKGLQANPHGSFRVVYSDGDTDLNPCLMHELGPYIINSSGKTFMCAQLMCALFYSSYKVRAGFSLDGITFKDGNSRNLSAKNISPARAQNELFS